MRHLVFGQPIQRPSGKVPSTPGPQSRCAQAPHKSVHELMLQLTGIDITRCPLCQKGTLVFFANLPAPHHGILRDDRSTNKKPCACPAPLPRAHASVRLVSSFHLFLAHSHFGVSLAGDPQVNLMRPGSLHDHHPAMSARRSPLVTIPIDNRHCFTQRFSPTGFILNASDSNCCRPIASARIQVKTYPFSSISG